MYLSVLPLSLGIASIAASPLWWSVRPRASNLFARPETFDAVNCKHQARHGRLQGELAWRAEVKQHVRCICLRVVVIVGGGLARRRRTGAHHAAMREAPLEKRWMAVPAATPAPACYKSALGNNMNHSRAALAPRTLASKLRELAELGPERYSSG